MDDDSFANDALGNLLLCRLLTSPYHCIAIGGGCVLADGGTKGANGKGGGIGNITGDSRPRDNMLGGLSHIFIAAIRIQYPSPPSWSLQGP